MAGQLRELRHNTHPKTGARLPDPVEVDEGSITAMKVYCSRIVPPEPSADWINQSPPEGLYFYEPEAFPAALLSDSRHAADRGRQLHERVRIKENNVI